ncbi:MAG: gliding motility-associated C-terminal domain-containing protein [Bacteroidales bacterium]
MRSGIIILFSVLTAFPAWASITADTVNVFQTDTTLHCNVDSLALDAGAGYVSYQWNTGDTTRVIFVKETDTYAVTRNDGTTNETAECYVINARIIQEPDTLCYKTDFFFEASPNNLSYLWSNGDTNYFTNAVITDTTFFSVEISDGTNSCTDEIKINMYPRIFVDFEQPNLICPGGQDCKGQVKATASGGLPPYHYHWQAKIDPGDSSYAIGLCEGQYNITVTDGYGCSFDTLYEVELFDLPDIDIERDKDTVYITDPRTAFWFTNNSVDSIQLTDWSWSFGDGTKSDQETPTHFYNKVGNYEAFFKYTIQQGGCQDSIMMTVPVKELELDIPNVFTPNGDGINDHFEIKKLENYISNEIVIYNRWGSKVYERSNYNNEWDGGNLDDGVYFYVLKCTGYFEDSEFYGSITILGKN